MSAQGTLDLSSGNQGLTLGGATSGTTKLQPSAVATGTLTLPAPAVSDTLVGKATTDTLTNKTLTSPTLTTPAIGVATGTSLALTGALTTSTPSAAVGFATGAGGTGTQATSKETTVVASPNPCKCGTITTHTEQLNAATITSFTFTNTALTANSIIDIQHQSGGTVGAYTVTAIGGSGTGTVYLRNNTAGNLSEALVLRFTIREAPTS